MNQLAVMVYFVLFLWALDRYPLKTASVSTDRTIHEFTFTGISDRWVYIYRAELIDGYPAGTKK
jgi:hypothetical protein